MTLTRILAASVSGIRAFVVETEVNLGRGLPNVIIVGLPDAAVKEARDRVKLAICNAGYKFPGGRVTINLAPAEQKKSGGLDLAMALGILAASKALPQGCLHGVAAVGELALSGELRSIRGTLSVTEMLARQEGIKKILVPEKSRGELTIYHSKVSLIPIDNLAQAVGYLRGQIDIPALKFDSDSFSKSHNQSREADLDLADVKGQEMAKRAMLVAAAGHHGLLLCGPPGSGKSMLARCLPGITPRLTPEEAYEITKIYSVCGLLPDNKTLITLRPFRAPHHSISDAGLVGGGRGPRPGEISLAHNGILFLDELPEFNRRVLEMLREPLENHKIIISRAAGRECFPANFQFVAAMNPCPCGYAGQRERRCRCSTQAIHRYQGKLSGPLLDRIDIRVDVESIGFDELTARKRSSLTSEMARQQVARARDIQNKRLGAGRTNSRLTEKEVRQFCQLSKDVHALLRHAARRLDLSARGIVRTQKVARTLADMDGCDDIQIKHITEALSWRASSNLY